MFCVTGPSFECCSGFAEFWRRESLPFSSWLQKVRECNAWASITMESNMLACFMTEWLGSFLAHHALPEALPRLLDFSSWACMAHFVYCCSDGLIEVVELFNVLRHGTLV